MLSGLRRPLQYAVLISGSGSTLQSLLEMHHQINIKLVISNKEQALGLLKAKRFGKTGLVLKNPVDYQQLHKTLVENKIDRIILAGYMKLIPAFFVSLWEGKIMNIHPSLLPKFPGLDSAFKSWEGQSDMGVTLHYVNQEMDAGEIYKQQRSLQAPWDVDCSFEKAEILLRRTEQHALRELAQRWN